jgi:hypothetical protein
MGLSNYIPSSRIAQSGVCTSSTRPASPFEGQMIYETDTDRVLVWNGSAWYPNWNTAWGFVAQATLATSLNYNNGTYDVLSLTFSTVANRRYRYTASGLIVNSGTGIYQSALTDASNNALREHYGYFAVSSNNYQISFIDYIETASSTGSVTRKIRNITQSPAVYYYGSDVRDSIAWKIRVEDIGPA